jgi:hypothetical protein
MLIKNISLFQSQKENTLIFTEIFIIGEHAKLNKEVFNSKLLFLFRNRPFSLLFSLLQILSQSFLQEAEKRNQVITDKPLFGFSLLKFIPHNQRKTSFRISQSYFLDTHIVGCYDRNRF